MAQKSLSALQFDYVLRSVEDPAKFVSVPPPERAVQPEDEVKARVEANRPPLPFKDGKRRRQEAPPPATEEAPLGIFRSSEEAKVVDAALGAAPGAASRHDGPGPGKSACAMPCGARLVATKARGRGLPVCDAGGRVARVDHAPTSPRTLGEGQDDAAGRTVVASFLNSEQMALALDNDAQWLARSGA